MQRGKDILYQLSTITKEAGELIMQARADGLSVQYKGDASPVTHADEQANALIEEALQKAFPAIPVISEEGKNEAVVVHAPYFWLVDPLDGTKGFIRGEDEFTVNIGLIENRKTVAGVIYLPARDVLYLGSDEAGAWRIGKDGREEAIRVNVPEGNKRSALTSKHHASEKEKEILSRYEITRQVGASSSFKFCLVADGTADIYPRTGPTMEWDTAAGHAILLAAGGKMTTLEGRVFLYGKHDFRNPGFIANC